MKKYSVAIFMSVVSLAFSVFSAPSNSSLFIDVKGYKLGDAGDWRSFDDLQGLSVVTPAHGEGLVYSNATYSAQNKNVYTVAVPFGYRVGKWLKAYDDSFTFTDGEMVEGSEGALTVTIPWDSRCKSRIYLGLVLEYDDNRTFTLGKSPFGAGTVGTNLGVYACLKGDVFNLAAIPSHDDETGLDRSTFRRWSDGVTDARRTVVIDTNLTLLAEFVPLSWQVAFDANGGTVLPSEKTVTCDAAYGWLPTPVRPGHSFVGWFSEPLNGNRVGFDTTVGAIGDHFLYAHWDAASCVIGFELHGEGNGTVEGVGRFPYGTSTILQAKPYEGSVFVKWEDGETRNPRRIDVTGDATYGACFDVATYDVTFTYRNAEGEWTVSSPIQKVRYGEAAVPPDASEYDSWPEHHFRAWSTEDYKAVTRGLAGQQSVQAIYDAQTYKVTFVYSDRDGNAVTTMPQHVEAGKAAVPPADSVANNWIGHARTGWSPDYSVIGSNLTVTAVYELRQYDVTFAYVDGNGKDAKYSEPVSFGETVPFEHVESLKTQWGGHTFKYWSLGNRPVTPPVVVSNDLHIAAVYEGYAHISYDANGAEGEMPTEVYTNFIGQVELASNAFTKTGYTFTHWSMDGSKEMFKDRAVVMLEDGSAYDLKANWVPISYTVAFDGNGGTIDVGPRQVNYDEVFQQKIGVGNITAPSGWDILGFSTNKETKVPEYVWKQGSGLDLVVSNMTTKADDVVTFYAIWKAETQMIVIDRGTGSPESVPSETGATFADPGDPKQRAGYRFGGWTTNGTDVVEFPIIVPPNGFTLTALWTPNRSRVVFTGTDGTYETSGTMEPQEFTYGVAQALTSNGFARTGHTFANWTNATGDVFADGATVSNLTAEADGEVSLRASWAANAYTVEFRSPGESYTQDFTYDTPQELTPNTFAAPETMVFDCWTNAVNLTTYADCEEVCNLATGGVFVLYATWKEAPSYTVAFEGAGGTNATGAARYEQTIECGKATALTANRFARTGYGFAGWAAAESSGSTVVYTNGEIVTDLAPTNGTATLYATWTPNRYTVTFNGNGADGGETAPQDFTYGVAQTLTPNGFTRTGHTFANWTNATGEVFADRAVVSNLTDEADADVPLFAAWTVNRYEIRYDAAGGTAVDAQTNEYGAATSAPQPPTKTGHAFAGWYAGETRFAFGGPMPAENLVLTAHWTPNRYTVKFLPGEGDGTMEDQSFVYGVPQALAANLFTHSGWKVFANWTTANGDVFANGAEVTNLTSEANGVVVLTACWADVPSYAVAFDGNGATAGAMPELRVACGAGGTLTSNRFARTGHTFANWTNETGDVFADGATFAEDLAPTNGTATLYAAWTPNRYRVVFDGNGADGGETAPQDFTYGVAQALTPNGFTRTGHTFANWTNATGEVFADRAVVSNLTDEADADVPLFAAWTVNRHQLTFDGNGSPRNYGSVIDPPDPTVRPGYDFIGWFAGETEYVPGMRMPDHDLAFVSRWTPISYTIAFDANGGSGTMTNYPAAYDQEIVLPVCEFTREGYEFVQWTNATKRAKAGTSVSNLTTTAHATVTLFAQWDKVGNRLSQALGTELEVTSPNDAWKVKGEPAEKAGVVRMSTDPEGTLRIKIPNAGTFSCWFDCGGDKLNGLHWKYYPEGGAEIEGETLFGNQTIPLEPPSAGTLEFSGTPSSGITWKLSDVSFE